MLLAALLCIMAGAAHGQELFVQAEPASNMPAHSLGIRLNNWVMEEQPSREINYHFIPEVMWGVNKLVMVHAEAFFSNRTGGYEGAGLYAKYRFLSHDAEHRHFRMAAFGRVSTNNAPIHQEEVQTNGHNTGYQLGAIATELLHKTAVSGTVFYHKAVDNGKGNALPSGYSGNAVSYSLSAGRLMLPRVYTGYKQVNLNLMAEVIGQVLPDRGVHYIDIAPAVQLIFNSQTRLDLSYRHQMAGNMQRTAPNGMLIRVEHLLFNVL